MKVPPQIAAANFGKPARHFPIMLATSASVGAADNVQEIYDTLSSKDKKLFWIDGTEQRFQGYDGSRDKFSGSVS
jgi:hypothetical protein